MAALAWPPNATNDARLLVHVRAFRGFADGLVSVLLADYLVRLGLSDVQVGSVVTGTLFGSALVTLSLGIFGHAWRRRPILFFAAALMAATGLGFVWVRAFVPLFVVAFIGTMNPSAGDVSLFLPTEQSALAEVVPGRDRPRIFAWYNLGGSFAGALGALAGGLPAIVARTRGIDLAEAERGAFWAYALVAVIAASGYRRLSPEIEHRSTRPAAPLARSRAMVTKLALLFSIDSFGGGFVVQSLLVYWLHRRFGLSAEVTSALFFVFGINQALSQFLAGRLAARIGYVRTMVSTHLPASVALLLCGLAPNATMAIALLLVRSLLGSMDVPARQAFVMAVVPPEERTAASSVTNVPRSLASAIPPLLTGWIFAHTDGGLALVIGGALKTIYDLLLLYLFRSVKVEER